MAYTKSDLGPKFINGVEVARTDAIAATCALHGGSIHDHGEQMTEALKDLCDNQRALWGKDIRPEDNRWFQHFNKSDKQN